MPSERVQRQIDRLLDGVEEAIARQDWTAVGEGARSVLRLDPENQDALAFLAAAERDVTPLASQPESPDGPDTTTRSRLDQYIPKELLDKLEGVRRSGSSSGERRVVTMLFCDVTGSTSVAETLDPEEWAEIMNGAFEHLISPIYRYEGTLARLMGDAINLAARMEQTAAPGTVQISSDTYNLVAPLFELEGPASIEIKGKSEPVSAYRVLSQKTTPGTLQGIEGLSTALVGRDGEISELRGVLERLQNGRGAVVCLIGEAGLGKSSLLSELHTEWHKIAGDDASWVESRGVSYNASRPFGLFSHGTRQALGVTDGDSIETVRPR